MLVKHLSVFFVLFVVSSGTVSSSEFRLKNMPAKYADVEGAILEEDSQIILILTKDGMLSRSIDSIEIVKRDPEGDKKFIQQYAPTNQAYQEYLKRKQGQPVRTAPRQTAPTSSPKSSSFLKKEAERSIRIPKPTDPKVIAFTRLAEEFLENQPPGNALEYYVQANILGVENLSDQKSGDRLQAYLKEPRPTSTTRRHVERLIRQNGDLLYVLKRGTTSEYCSFPPVESLTAPTHTGLLYAGDLLAADAQLKAESGDMAESAQAYMHAAKFGHDLANSAPMLIQYLISVKARQDTFRSLSNFLSEMTFPNDSLAEMGEYLRTLRQNRNPKAIQTVLETERRMSSATLKQTYTKVKEQFPGFSLENYEVQREKAQEELKTMSGEERQKAEAQLAQLDTVMGDLAKGLEFWEGEGKQILTIYTKPYKEYKDVDLKAKMEGYGRFVTMAMPNYKTVMIRCLSAQVHEDLAALALDARLYEAENGRLPGGPRDLPNWNNIVGPYTDEPYLWKTSGSELVLYSVGPDLVDEKARSPYDSAANGTDSGGDIYITLKPIKR